MRRIARRWSALVATATLAVRLLVPDLGHQCAVDLAGPLGLAAIERASAAPPLHTGESTTATHAASESAPRQNAQGQYAHAQEPHEHAPADDMHAGHGTASDADNGPAHDCDCETTCCCVATAATHVANAAPVFASFTLARTLAISSADQWELPWADHVLPFNTPPPVVTLG